MSMAMSCPSSTEGIATALFMQDLKKTVVTRSAYLIRADKPTWTQRVPMNWSRRTAADAAGSCGPHLRQLT